MVKRKSKELTDYNYLCPILNEYSILFCRGLVQTKVFHFLIKASLSFNRIYVELRPSHFAKGFPKYLICGLPWKIREIRKARRALKDSGLIFYDYLPQNSTKAVKYIINVARMLNILKRVISKEQFPDALYKKAIVDARELNVNSEQYIVYQEEYVMKIEEALKEGYKKSTTAQSKKLEVIRLKENPSSSNVVEMIKEYCALYKVDCVGRLTVKDQANMKRWARIYSAQSGVANTWWEHLELIIKHWSNMKTILRWPEGDKMIVLDDAFSWEWYFNRKGISALIDGWLAVNKDEPQNIYKAFADSVIDLTKRREAK